MFIKLEVTVCMEITPDPIKISTRLALPMFTNEVI